MRITFFSIVAGLLLSASAIGLPHTIEAPLRVMVLPFRAIGDVGTYTWIGDGVEQSLIVRASRPGATVLTAPPQLAGPGPAMEPLAQAKTAGAIEVVMGSYQILNGDIRLTGQVLNVEDGKAMGALSATGPMRDLFKLEDDLSRQLDDVLPGSNPNNGEVVPSAVPGTYDTYEPMYSSAPSGSYYNSSPDDTYYPRYYSPAYYDAAYPGWIYNDYGYLPFYSGFYFGSGFGYGFHDRHGHLHNWDGHHFVDRGSFGHEFNHGGSQARAFYDHGWNYRPNGPGRGFAPVGSTVGGSFFNPASAGVSRQAEGFSVGHAGFRPAENFSTPSPGGNAPLITHGIGTPGAAMGGGFDGSAGGGTAGSHAGFAGGAGSGGHVGGIGGHAGGGGHR